MERNQDKTNEVVADLLNGIMKLVDIAMKNGVSLKFVSQVARDYGIEKRGRPHTHPDNKATFYLECAYLGLNQSEIARLAGVTPPNVRSTLLRLRENGYPVPLKIFGKKKPRTIEIGA